MMELLNEGMALDAPLIEKAVWTAIVLFLLTLASRLVRQSLLRLVSDPVVRQRYWSLARNLQLFVALALLVGVWVQELKTVSLLLTGLMAAFLVANRELILGLVGRVTLSVTDQYKIGDRVAINGVSGDVINIGLLFTWMMEVAGAKGELQSTGTIVWIPHNWLLQHALVNLTHLSPYVWDEIQLTFSIHEDPEKVMALATQTTTELLAEETALADAAQHHIQRSYAAKMPPSTPVSYCHVDRHTDGLQFWVLTLRFLVPTRQRRQIHSLVTIQVVQALKEAQVPLLAKPQRSSS
ncbi:MAG: mechanosensitive ion channel family protein [Deltaproteobacteria bacterium]|nr:mechanosensitive ion channel family protein [Deltaproteobacteria bacterium]